LIINEGDTLEIYGSAIELVLNKNIDTGLNLGGGWTNVTTAIPSYPFNLTDLGVRSPNSITIYGIRINGVRITNGIANGGHSAATIGADGTATFAGGTMTGDLNMGSNKITYSNVYMTEADLPNASTYHGMFAHVHATGAGYYSHAGQWIKLQNEGASVVLPSGSNETPELSFAADPDTGFRCPSDGEVSVVCNGAQAAKINSAGVEAQNFNATSDITLKQDISVIDNAMEMIQNLEGINWSWKNNGKAAMGVSAQNVEQVAPQLVGNGEYKSVNYNGLVGILIEAVKSLKEEIDELKK
jgi:hypothetical protein